MRPIDADKLHKDIYNGPGTDLQKFFAACCVAAAPTVNPYEWISVEDGSPEDSDDYLVYVRYTPFTKIVTMRSYSKERGWYGVRHGRYYIETGVTHWMSRPAPPTEKGN